MTSSIFHLAFAVNDIPSTRQFYQDVLGCRLGRETGHWLDIDFFGHQLSAHVSDNPPVEEGSEVDGIIVPLRHFGAVLAGDEWDALVARIEAAKVDFVLPPQLRYQGKKGEQRTFFIKDLSGNGLEFKTFTRQDEVFA